MNKFEQHITQAAKSVALTDAEKQRLREHLVQYQEHTPLREASSPQPSVSYVSLFQDRLLVRALMLLLIVGLGAGAHNVASRALPGDALFGVRLATEEVSGALSLTTAQRATWEVERVHRRAADIALLNAEGALTPERESDALTRFAQAQVKAEEYVAQLEAADSARAEALRIALATRTVAYSAPKATEMAPAPAMARMSAPASLAEEAAYTQDESATVQMMAFSVNDAEELPSQTLPEDAMLSTVATDMAIQAAPMVSEVVVRELAAFVAQEVARVENSTGAAQHPEEVEALKMSFQDAQQTLTEGEYAQAQALLTMILTQADNLRILFAVSER